MGEISVDLAPWAPAMPSTAGRNIAEPEANACPPFPYPRTTWRQQPVSLITHMVFPHILLLIISRPAPHAGKRRGP